MEACKHVSPSVYVCVHARVHLCSSSTCTWVCVWLAYRECLHYTLFRLIWLTLNRYWFPLFCSLRLPHSLSPSLLPSSCLPHPSFLCSGPVPASAKQIPFLPPLFHFCSLVISPCNTQNSFCMANIRMFQHSVWMRVNVWWPVKAIKTYCMRTRYVWQC